jgi:glycosyltransferase involved in cell wall biosynthesis
VSAEPVRVLHVSVVHRADDPRIFDRECLSLGAAGYDVNLLAVSGTPTGADGGPLMNGVRIIGIPARRRSQRWLSARDVLRVARRLRPAVAHLHDPELLAALPVLHALGSRVVYDMHEHVALSVLGKQYIPPRLRPPTAHVVGLTERTLAARADGVVAVVEHQLANLGPQPTCRVVLPNYPRFSRFADLHPVADLAADERLKLIHVGTLARGRGTSLMLEVMGRVDGAVLYLGGVFHDPAYEREVRALVEAELSDRVRLLGRVAPAAVPDHLAAADVVWVPSQPSPQYSLPAVTTKLFEGLGAGCAALVSDLPGRGDVVRDRECGLAVEPTVQGHARGVATLCASRDAVAEMGRRGRTAVHERYCWEAVQDRLLDFYAELLQSPNRPASAA